MRRRLLWAGLALAALVGATAALALLPLPERLAAPGSAVVFYQDGAPAHVFLSADERWRVPVHLDEVDPHYLGALIALEDRRFWWHPGVDPIAVLRAALSNLRAGEVVSGASTLTMQLVRMLEPRPRTLRSKAIEAARALQLEMRLSKAEILEAYLQFLPFGRNVEGVEAAALSYFGHRASALSPAEICTLLAVPQDPNGRYPTPQHQAKLAAARDEIAARLVQEGALPMGEGEAQISEASLLQMIKGQAAPLALRAFPRGAPHAAVWLRAQRPGEGRIATSLDAGAQRLAEGHVAAARARAEADGIHNVAVVVLDHHSRQVRALVGSFDFWAPGQGGQIPAFAVPRAVGSTLKPFIYAQAIDRGVALPEHLVADVPVHFGSYAPRNYGETYDGLVRLEDALSRSLNVPFVTLLGELGVEPFLGLLRAMGARTLVPEPGYYGLSVAAGGVELAPVELAGLYATLAQDGLTAPVEVMPPRRAAAEGDTPPVRVLSEGASWLTQRALSKRDRPDFPTRRQISRLPPSIHWKTGTSFGHRDAWAVGSGPTYTVVVWMGNLDNQPSVALVGAEAAGPLLFDLLEGLERRAPGPGPSPPPADLKWLTVCAWSGHLPTPACPSRKQALARRESVPMQRCPFHVQLQIDKSTGLALSPRCSAGRPSEWKTFLVLPASVRRWLADDRRPLPGAPSYAPGCEVAGDRAPPQIVSPGQGLVVMLLKGLDASDQQLPLEAETQAAGASLSWFVDGAFLGTVGAEERLWWQPSPGSHEVLVVDDVGLKASRVVQVREGG